MESVANSNLSEACGFGRVRMGRITIVGRNQHYDIKVQLEVGSEVS